MAENFAEQLRRSTLSSEDFTKKYQNIINDKFRHHIDLTVTWIKDELMSKTVQHKFQIVNNKRMIVSSFTINGQDDYKHFPVFYKTDVEGIEDANLLSYLNSTCIYQIYSYGQTANSMISNASCHPTQTSLWHRWTSQDTNWNGNFNLSKALINHLNVLCRKLNNEGIILSSFTLPICLGKKMAVKRIEIAMDDLEKTHFVSFTVPTHLSFDNYTPTLSTGCEITLNYYIYLD